MGSFTGTSFTNTKQLYEKTKQLDDLKTQFFSNVSHELRTPLTLVIGPVERMLASAQSSASQRLDLEVIARNARTLLRHVNDLLDISKLEANQMKTEYANTDLARLIRFVASHFEVLAHEKHMHYSVNLPERLQAQIDPDKFRRVLLNLLSNAFKFTPSGGSIRISANQQEETIHIEVGDSGPGIPAEKRELVFERFHQLEGSATRRFGGTGLGLTIARELVELHHGSLTLCAAPEGGALFVVDLPQKAPPDTLLHDAETKQTDPAEARQIIDELLAPHHQASPGANKGALILVVEDNAEMNQFICESLGSEYRIASAFNGKEGLGKAIELKPDLILTDIMMPIMSGEELIRALRENSALDLIPILLLTAKADDALRVKLLHEGAQDCLTKPFSVVELLARVRVLLTGKTNLEALQRSEERYRALIDHASEGIFIADANEHYIDVNRAGCRMLGYLPEEIIGKSFVDLIPGEEIDRLLRVRKQLEAGAIDIAEWSLKMKNGTFLPVEVSANIITVNQAFHTITGYQYEEVLGKNPRLHHSGRQDGEFYHDMWNCLKETGLWKGEIWNRRKNGEIYPAWENISAVTNSHGQTTHYVSVFSDISALKQAEERLIHLAHHDTLTGLPNRLLFATSLEKSLERAKRQGKKVALLFLDLDRFKRINDTLGHAAGDQLLKQVSTRLIHTVRAEDMVARLGGDEFTVVLEGIVHPDDAAHLAEKIISAFATPMDLNGKEIFSSTSIGISLYPDDAHNVEDLTKAADAAMYRAKERGRHTFEFFTEALNVQAQEHLLMENGLRNALNRNELELYYQPQVNIASGDAIGMEALLRWRHPQLGVIQPERFIAVAEESGLIQPIGEWVIQQACAQAHRWLTEGLQPSRIAINISGRQVLSTLPDMLRNALSDNNLPPDEIQLELEVTETVLQSLDHSIEILNQLRELGIRIAIDDFGTGYSSLGRLKQLPIDTLKIDSIFVHNIANDANDRAITSAIITMGHNLGLCVIAEGVETNSQLDFLREQGCDEVQGFLLGEPLPAEAMTQLLVEKEGVRRQRSLIST